MPDHPNSGHFTCSWERTDHVLPTAPGTAIDAREFVRYPARHVTHPDAPTPATAAPAAAAPRAAAGVLLLAGLLLRRFSRRRLILCLVLLLTLFVVESALHSVHHGFDPARAEACSLAMASAHLSAVTVDGVVETSIILAAPGRATQPDPSPVPARVLGPDPGRAPPPPAA